MIDWSKTDALIFDMDGTLWDAVDSYAEIWNRCFASFGVDMTVTRAQVLDCMGLPNDKIYEKLAGPDLPVAPEVFMPVLEKREEELMPVLGGKPYPGVKDGIEQLSKKYVILLLSNCGKTGLVNMMRHVGITDFVTDAVTFGETHRYKDENMVMLKEKYGLKQPVYVGDTNGDCISTHKAGLPFVHVTYGFGDCQNADISFSSFADLTDFFLKIKL